ncbi:MAG: sodium/solute symporter [Candidatus Dormibacteria bacterium]
MTISAAVLGLLAMTILTLAVGTATRRFGRTTSDLLVAARAVRPGLNAAAISGEYLSAASFLGVAGLVMKFGFDVLWYPVGYAAGYLMLLVFIAGPLRRFGAYTIPDFAEGRFESPGFRRVAVAIVILIGLFYMFPQMKAAGLTLATSAGVPYWIGVVLIAVVVASNVMVGGMRGITMVQSVQFGVKILAISIPAFVLIAHFGLPGQLFRDASKSRYPVAETTTRIDVSAGTVWRLPAPAHIRVDRPASVEVLNTSNSDPGVLAFSNEQARPPGKSHTPPINIVSTQVLPEGTLRWREAAVTYIAPGSALPFGSQTPISSTGDWLKPFGPLAGGSRHPLLFTYSLILAIVFGTIGLPHILVRFYTNRDGRAARRTALIVLGLLGLFYVWTPLYGLLGRLKTPQLYSNDLTDTVVLVLPQVLTPGLVRELLSALLAAGAFAAFASTLSGLLVSLAGALGHDVYGNWLRPDSSPRARALAFRLSALLFAGIGVLGSVVVEHFDISVLVGWAFAIAASSFFPLLLLGIWWPRLNLVGAALGATVGAVSATIAIVTTMIGAAWLPVGQLLAGHPALAVILAQPAIVTVPLSFSVMVVLSRLRPPNRAVAAAKMLQLHVPERLGLRKDYIAD